MNNQVPARGFRAHQATVPGGRAPGVFAPRLAYATHAVLESLEGRRLLSSVSLSGGVLKLVGDANSHNDLVVQPAASGKIFVYANNVSKTFRTADVKSVQFTGGSKADGIFLASKLELDAVVNAGAGDDDIRLGEGDDVVNAGDGDDKIWTRPGNDKAYGGNGDDRFLGDEGNDVFEGGPGNDSADGGGGNDAILAGTGNDSVIGGNGDDKLDAGAGNDYVRADAGSDTLLGGDGDDTLGGGSGADTFDGGEGRDTFLDLRAEDKVPHGSAEATPGGGNGNDEGGYTGVGITDNEETVIGRTVDSQTPRPVLNLIGKTGTGPHTVHAHGLASTLNAGSYLTARWQWDFGDPGSRFNQLEGWNAAHVYNRPGTYTIRLTITNENGKSNSVSTTVRVVEDNRRTIYVDAVAGRDSNSGLSENSAVRSVSRIAQLAGSHTRILFKRGQKHTFDRTLNLPYQDVLVGTYGSGERPILWRLRGNGVSTLATYSNSNQVTFQDLVFDSPYVVQGNKAPNIGVDGIYPRGVNMTIRGCEFRNLDDAINSNGQPRGLLVQDNTAPLATGLRNYFVWSEGSDHVYLGNSAANSTREHNVRASGTTRMLVAYNNFTNLDRSSVDGPDYSKGTVEVHKGSFAYVWRNELHDGALRSGPRGADYEPNTVKTEWVVFDSNELYEHNITIKIGTHHLIARNNVIRTNTSSAFSVETTDPWGRTVSDISIVNNTGITTEAVAKFLNLPGAASSRGAITFKNNLWVAPNFAAATRGSAPVYVDAMNLDMFKEISNNVYPMPVKWGSYGDGGLHYVWDYWSDKRGYKDFDEWDAYSNVHDEMYERTAVTSDLAPKRGSDAFDGGEAVKGVWGDMYGNSRPRNGKVTVGAVQSW
jgi:Ca2+-binding RTX toxin-like protein